MDELWHTQTHVVHNHSEISEISLVTQLGSYSLIALEQVLLTGLNS